MSVKVSIVFAAHNDSENSVCAALESIKEQSFKDFEVIMIDAASTDDCKVKMEGFCSDKRFKLLSIAQNKISVARNLGIEKAEGKYISFGDPSVIFTKNFLSGMIDVSEKENADLCVARMASSDVYGKHEFSSTGSLLRRKKTTRFDTDLIWNPAVTNKLFLKSKIEELDLQFKSFGKAREAAFTIPFAFESNTIVCSSKGAASYVIPVKNEGVAQFPIEHYLDAYELITEKATIAFDRDIANEATEFGKKELQKLKVCYLDQVLLKEITVLLYSYYRHFWLISDEEIIKYTSIITKLIDELSSSGKKSLFDKNKDIFFSGELINSKSEMAQNPRVTVCVGKSEHRGHLHEQRLKIQLSSIFNQTMPCFELLVDERLKDIFPSEWLSMPNIRFISGASLGEFKDACLAEAKTNYIMYQDGFARLNPKILMRHYTALEGREKYGFTTSPLTKFDGKQTKEYSFSDIAFYSDMTRTRTDVHDYTFALDLFFCNKLFSVTHLNGIRFSFSDNPIVDMYKLYSHSRFKKLSHRGAYLPYTEEEALEYLKEQQKFLVPECKRLYKSYHKVYYRRVTAVKQKNKLILTLKKIKRHVFAFIARIYYLIFSHAKIKDRVFFYSIRSDGEFLENMKCVFDAYDGKKVYYAKMLPHSVKDIAKIKRYMLTSKVIVVDDYMKYLRTIRLREGQSVVQIWHAGGAFKRFGLDAPSRLTRLEEYKTHSQYTDVCVSSEYVRQFYAHAFGVDMEVVKPLGSPRTDLMLNKEKRSAEKEQIISRHPLLKDKKVYIYFPTFREIDGVLSDFDPKIDWSKLNDELLDDEVFIISRHPVMKSPFFHDVFYSRIKDYTFEPTTELLSVADAIVTDYSSIIFDASLLSLPTVFYCPDYDSYERSFYLNYEKDLPGQIVMKDSDLLSALRASLSDENKNEIMSFCSKQMGACDGNSTKRIVELINNRLSEKYEQ